MADMKIWENPEFGELRIVEMNGEPWMVGRDVAQALGYFNVSKAVATHVDSEDKRFEMLPIADAQNGHVLGATKTTLINESGLYSLVLSSKLPGAKRFRRWVTGEVLPSIRKDGAYMTPETLQAALLNPDTMIQLCQQLKDERERSERLKAANERLEPAARYAHDCLLADGGRLASSIAQEYGMSAIKFNKLLHRLGIQYKQGGQWLLYAKHTGKGYTETRVNLIPHNDGFTHQHPETLWTAKGRAFLYKKLKDVGYVPLKGEMS